MLIPLKLSVLIREPFVPTSMSCHLKVCATFRAEREQLAESAEAGKRQKVLLSLLYAKTTSRVVELQIMTPICNDPGIVYI